MIETERLVMRKLTAEDLPWLIEMRSRPEVNKYLGGPQMQTPEAVTKRFNFYLECYEKFGFGQCAMILKSNREMIGLSGLQPLDDTGEIEVGYSLIPEYWQMGLGYESAEGWLKYGFEQCGLEKIVAVAVPENKGSRRIMEKCGMSFEVMSEQYGMMLVLYSISKEEFFNRPTGPPS